MLGDVAAARGHYEAARQKYLTALEVRSFLGQEQCRPSILEALGALDTRLARYEDAEVELLQCLEGYRKMQDHVGMAMACRDLGTLHYARNEDALASRWLNRAMDQVKGKGKDDLEHDIRARLALVAARGGDVAEARQVLLQCLAYWQSRGHAKWIEDTKKQLDSLAELPHSAIYSRR
jgi:tetratricopeptide (TPR) repeat protein